MQNIVHKIDLNLSQPNNFQYIYCVQGDYDSESVIATLYDGNQLYTIEGKAMLQGSTEDGGLVLQNDLPISDDKHSVTFTLTKEILSSSGDITVNIVLIDPTNNQKKSTFPMIIKCNPDITGRTPVSVLTTIQEYVERSENAAKESEANKVTTDENVIKATEQANIATAKATASANSAKESSESAKNAQTKVTESANSAQTAKEQAEIATTKAQEASSSATDSAKSARASATSASNAKTSETNAEKYATASANSASASADSAATSAEKAKESFDSATAAALSEKNAKASETASKTSETNAKTSEENASASATTATEQAKASSNSATASALSEKNAKTSEVNSKASENASALSEKNAKLSETASALSESNAKTSAATATTMADEASASAVTANEKATLATTKADEAALSATNASTSAKDANTSADIATAKTKEASASAIASSDSATQANESATIASGKASDATGSANSANMSATNASKSEANAKNSADSASLSATNASTSETNAQSSATASSKSAQASATSEANAKQSATNAKASETSASKYASNASISATTASEEADVATAKATESANSATDSLTYANQSKDYRDQCKSIAQGLEGALLPKGTIAFAELPTKDINTGDMYNISDEFTSDNRFKDGSGKSYTAGTNIYYTSDGLWDVLIGDLEKYAFKTDLEDHISDKSNPHNVTKSQVGLGNVPNVSTNDQTVTYTDSSTLSTLSSGEKMSVAFGKIKKAISDLISHIADTTKHITSSERTLWNTVSDKVDKVDGKGLSTNDFTTEEKNKLNGIATGANKTTVDGSLSSTSTNPVQNKVINSALSGKVELSADGVSKAINQLSVGISDPTDNDYYVSQYVNGGTTTTSYHRRPMSALWSYIKGKADKVYATIAHTHSTADITDFPSSMPASDVSDWAKASSKPNYTASEVGALPTSGGTLTGKVNMKDSDYEDKLDTGQLNMNNSDIYGINSLKFFDLCDSAAEGIQWYRDSTHTDSLWVKNGVINFSPNRPWGTTDNTTNYTIIHSGNIGSQSVSNAATATLAADSNHVYSVDASSTKISMTFNWVGKDGQPSWLWGGSDGATMYVYNPSNFSVNNSTLWDGYTNDIGTLNSTDTWLLVANNNKIQHRLATDFATSGHNHDSTYLKLTGGTITGGTISMSSTGLPRLNGNATAANTTSIGKNGFIINGVDTANDGAAIFMENGGTESNKLIFALGDDATSDVPSKDYIGFRYYNTSGNVTYESKIPAKSGTIALTSDIPTNTNQLTNGAGFITGITKAMVTNALGYTPPTSDTNTWRGIQNNLTSTSTTDSLSANQGKVLKGLIDGKVELSADGVSKAINQLTIGTANPTDNDYYVAQYVGGGTTTTTYHRRSVSALWNYIKSKADKVYLPLSGGTMTGTLVSNGKSGSYNENIRLHPSSTNWTSIVMCGDDNTGASGTSAKTWGIFTYNGNFSIAKNGTALTSSSSANLTCDTNNVWKANGETLITSAGGTISNTLKVSRLATPKIHGSSNQEACIKITSYNSTQGEHYPSTTGVWSCGISANKWYAVWSLAYNGASDRKLKMNIEPIDVNFADKFIDGLKPASYKFKDNMYGKTHTGFIAQDVEELMLSLGMQRTDFAGLVKVRKKTDEEKSQCKSFEEINYDPDNYEGDDKNYDYSLRYDDFIAPIVTYIQNLKRTIVSQNDKIINLQSRLEKIENTINV